jgi:hypothetical protein
MMPRDLACPRLLHLSALPLSGSFHPKSRVKHQASLRASVKKLRLKRLPAFENADRRCLIASFGRRESSNGSQKSEEEELQDMNSVESVIN